MDTWITEMCRTRCRRQLVVWSAVSAVGLLWLYAERDYVRGFVGGPRTIAAAELARLAEPDGSSEYYVAVSGTRAIDTGVREYSVKTEAGREIERTVSNTYYALEVGDKYLIVRTSGGAMPQAVAGELVTRPGDFDSHFFDSAEMRAKRDLFYPLMLSTASYREPGYWALGLMAGFVGLLLWKALPRLRWLRDPSSHPLVRRVASWGDPVDTAAIVERELLGPQVLQAGEWRLTDRHLVRMSLFSFDVLRLHDLLWAYKKRTKHSINFIPTGKTYAAQMHFYGGHAEIPGAEQRVNDILEAVVQRAPWAISGYSDQLAKSFRSNTADFCAAVEQRRAATRGLSAMG